MADRQRRKSDAARRANQTIRSRTVLMMLLFGVTTFVLLFMKLYDLQIVQHEKLQQQAVAQQTRSAVVSASRGTIYDKNGNVLAISATAETVFISPKEIADNKEDAAYIARGLSRILDVDEATVLEKTAKTYSEYVEIKKRVEQTTADEVRKFING
ncbi:MAG: stage V sporulation protein D, partial [Oscillibacter sp.]|nr:stage V sporulation protein D [Oscillibacter sp.]